MTPNGTAFDAADVSGGPGAGHILVVCTGNVCRSPYIEYLLARDLADLGITVTSAGTGALVGAPMDPEIRTRLEARGVRTDGFTSRQVVRQMVAEADLVIAATREHLSQVVPLHPKALRYAFSLLDLADLAGAVNEHDMATAPGSNRVSKLAAAAIAKRGVVNPRLPEDSGVVDPYRQPSEVFDRMAAQIGQALPVVAARLRG